MATAALAAPPPDEPPSSGEDVVWLHDATWEDYERLLAIRGEKSVPRISYVEGMLEIMSPSREHENIGSVIGRLVEVWCLEHGVRFSTYGSWTIKDRRHDRGAEPDECYVFGREQKDRPDLAIEVAWTSRGIDKLLIYKKLGVGEVWYWRKGQVEIYLLEGDEYSRSDASRVLPGLDVAELVTFVDRETTFDSVTDYRDSLRARRLPPG
jgi:Uma2 family endonuclease